MIKSPYELAYMRRVCVREQKRLMIIRKLEDDLPVGYLMLHCIILWILALLLVAIQIALIVYKSPLYYICSGFWVGAYFLLCSLVTALLSKNLLKNNENHYNYSIFFSLLCFIFLSFEKIIRLFDGKFRVTWSGHSD